MINDVEQKKWDTLARISHRHGFFYGIPAIKTRNGITTFSFQPFLYIVLIVSFFMITIFGGLVVITPWLVKRPFPQEWMDLILHNRKLLTVTVLLVFLGIIYGVRILLRLLCKRKVILKPVTGELEFHFGSYLFPRKMVLFRGQFEPVIQDKKQFHILKYQMLSLRRFDQTGKQINLFSISIPLGKTGYEKVMTFSSGHLPEDLVAHTEVNGEGTVIYSKAPLYQGGRFYRYLKFSSRSPELIVFHPCIAESIWTFFGGITLLSLPLYGGIIMSRRLTTEGSVLLGMGLLMLLYSLFDLNIHFMFRQVTIDKSRRQITITPTFPDRSINPSVYSFDKIAAIQICYLSKRDEKNPKNPGCVEVNLVFSAHENQRVTLAVVGDLPANHEKVQMIADFIDKPIVKHEI